MAEEKAKYTDISTLGEFGLIKHLTEKLEYIQPSSLKGVGDDAAVIAPPAQDEVILFSTDMLAENIHFDLTYTPLRHLGYKAVAVNVSDMCAMNGRASQVVVSLAISNQFSVEALDEIYKGIRFACQEFGVDLVGGDTTSSRSGLVINVSVIGIAKKDEVVYRSGANVGDYLCVSGDLGSAYAGLFLLERAKKTFEKDPAEKPDMQGYGYVLQRQLMPQARIDIIELFHLSGVIPTSMIDISDGLSSEVHHICRSSEVGCLVDENKIPVNEETAKVALEAGVSPTVFALNGGEDYELLFTLNPGDLNKIKDPTKITVIGEIMPAKDGIKLAGRDSKIYELKSTGWDGLTAK